MAYTTDDRKQSYEGHHPQTDQSLTLFVGCLDPLTTKDEIVSYFKNYDHWIKGKLIVNFKTGQSKQCALLFCSNQKGVNAILEIDHYLRNRRLRINLAQKDLKGTKNLDLFQIQISGLEPDVTEDSINDVFSCYKGFNKVRLVQGLHPKQKKVAIIYFDDHESARLILQSSHIRIGQKNCKITAYQKDTNSIAQSTPTSPVDNPPKKINITQSYLNFESESNETFMNKSTSEWGTPKTQTFNHDSYYHKPLSPLEITPIGKFTGLYSSIENQEYSQQNHHAFVHPVEAEKDDLYKIFCLPLPPIFSKKENTLLKKSSESKETREE